MDSVSQHSSSPSQPKRVSRACDYCRKKRLKCTADQHPCMNCRLYGSSCTYASLRKGPVSKYSTDQPNTRKRKSRAPVALPCADNNGSNTNNNSNHAAIDDGIDEMDTSSEMAPQRPTAATWNLENSGISEHLNTASIEADFDQYAREFGLVPSFFGRPESLTATDPDLAMAMPLQLPSPDVSGAHDGGLQAAASLRTLQGGPPLPPEQVYVPLPGLLLKRGLSDCKFLGLGAVGTTISACLKFYMEFHGSVMEADLLDNLVQGMRHVDELPLHKTPDNKIQPISLPNIVSAGQCVSAYFENIHLRHPIVEVSFLKEWQVIYRDPAVSDDPIQFSRFCLIVALGQMSLPPSSASTPDLEAFLQSVQSHTWSFTNQLLAYPFADSVEVLLLHVMYLLYCGKGGIAWMTCGIAIRIAQSLGLHRYSPVELGLKEEEYRRRSRLWEVAVTLDAFLSLTEGRPPAITTKNYPTMVTILSDQECPPKQTSEPAKLIHWWHVQLASIAHRLAVLLDQTETSMSTLEDLGILDRELLQWRDLLPMEYRPEQENLAKGQLFIMISCLHLQYFHLMRTLHWVSYSTWSQRPDMDVTQFGARIRSSEAICVNMSRALIGIINTSDETDGGTDVASLGFPVSYCMAAVAILFRHIVKRPGCISARTDLEILRAGVLYTQRLLHGNGPMKHFGDFFDSLQRVAENLVLRLPANNA